MSAAVDARRGRLAASREKLLQALRHGHRLGLLRSLLDAGSVPRAVSTAANDRLARFEETVQDLHALLAPEQEPAAAAAPARPKLTLCVTAA